MRLNALQRSQPPPPHLLPHCMDTNSATTAARYRVVVSTCVTAGLLYSLGLAVGHFSHVFVDEAGQATEPECLIPLGMLAGSDKQVDRQTNRQTDRWTNRQTERMYGHFLVPDTHRQCWQETHCSWELYCNPLWPSPMDWICLCWRG